MFLNLSPDEASYCVVRDGLDELSIVDGATVAPWSELAAASDDFHSLRRVDYDDVLWLYRADKARVTAQYRTNPSSYYSDCDERGCSVLYNLLPDLLDISMCGIEANGSGDITDWSTQIPFPTPDLREAFIAPWDKSCDEWIQWADDQLPPLLPSNPGGMTAIFVQPVDRHFKPGLMMHRVPW